MHFITFLKNKQTNVGIVESKDTLIDLSFYSPEIPNDLNQIIELNHLLNLMYGVCLNMASQISKREI